MVAENCTDVGNVLKIKGAGGLYITDHKNWFCGVF